MTTMVAEVYDAFIAAGAPEDKARAAAEALANYDDRFNRIGHQVQDVRADLRPVKWQIGLVAAALVVIGLPSLWLLVRIAARTGALPG